MKTFFLFTALLILLIGIGCAAAAEINDDSTDAIEQTSTAKDVSTDNKVINKVSDNKVTQTKEAANYTITESDYSKYFDSSSTAKSSAIANDSTLVLSGDFKNKDFIFDNIKLTLTSEKSTLYNTTIIAQNGAKIVIDGLNIKNTDKNEYTILLESNGNTLKNSNITVKDNQPLHAIEVTGNNTIISSIIANVTAPSADVEYDASNVGHPKTSGILIASDNNVLEDSKIYFDGSETTGYYPSADGIDLQSPSGNVIIKNNTIKSTIVKTTGPNYVYGINVGRAKNTEIEKVLVEVESDYYTNAIQLFDADGISISGTLNSKAKSEAYGVYSTAMGVGTSKDISLDAVDANVEAPTATGALFEGSSNVKVLGGSYNINGTSASPIKAYVDWKGNVPENITIEEAELNAYGTDDTSVLYFGLCKNVEVIYNDIYSEKGSKINFNNTKGGKVTDNTISINGTILGDAGVTTTESDTIVENNSALVKLTDATYSNYFNNDSIAIPTAITNDSLVIASGKFYNKDFIFDNVKAIFRGEKDSVFYNSTIISQNNATITIENINIENTNKNNYALLFESDDNYLYDSKITIKDNKALHGVEITGDYNYISGLVLNVTAPSADVEYDANYVGHPVSSALLIASDYNAVTESLISFDGSEKTGYYSSADGIDIQSPDANTTIENNRIMSTTVYTTCPNYVYGINVGRAKDTELYYVNVNVDSEYYSNGVQLFDADGIEITGTINSKATTEAYGVYSTAMGMGSSKNIELSELDINVNSDKATGVLIEGSSNITISDSAYEIKGKEATAISGYVDWMGNVPKGFNITELDIAINATGNSNVLYFGLAEDVTISNNTIKSVKGSEINFNSTKKAKVTDNYIVIGEDIFGDNAVITTENDTVVKNNQPYVTTIQLDKIANVPYSNNVTIKGKFVDSNGKSYANTNIKLTLNGKTINLKTATGGVFNYTTKATNVGTNNVTVAYAGNSKYGKVTNKTTFKVVKQNLSVTISKIANTAYKNNVTIKGNFADGNGRGIANTNLNLTINGKTVKVKTTSNGAFTYTTKATTVGTNNVTVSYAGNANYKKVSKKSTFKITKQNLTLNVNKIKSVVYKDNVTISGKLTDANGKVIMNTLIKININGKTFTAKTNNKGVYTLTTKTTAGGVNNVTVSYDGNKNYNKASVKTTFSVSKKGVVATVTNFKIKNGKLTITGKFTDSDKKVLMNSLVNVTINGKSANAKTNNKGVFTYTKSVPNGTIKVTVGYAGNNNYKSYTSIPLSVTVD